MCKSSRTHIASTTHILGHNLNRGPTVENRYETKTATGLPKTSTGQLKTVIGLPERGEGLPDSCDCLKQARNFPEKVQDSPKPV